MYDQKEDEYGNIYFIYVKDLIEGEDIINIIEIMKFDEKIKNINDDDIFITHMKENNNILDIDYRKLENRENKLFFETILYKNINIKKIYKYTIIYFPKNKNKIVNNSSLLIPDKETYGEIGENY